MKNYLITHYDMDGVGCYIALSQAVQFEKVWPCTYDYDRINKHISEMINATWPEKVRLFITDLNLTQEIIDSLDPKLIELVYIDHHPGSERLVPNINMNIFSDQKYSATKQCSEYAIICGHDISKIYKLVETIDAFDMHKFGTDMVPVYLNELFWHFKFDKFYDIFKDGFNKDNIAYMHLGKTIFDAKMEKTKQEELFVQDDICVNFDVSSLLYLKFLYNDKLNFYLSFYQPKKCSVRSKYNLQPFFDAIKDRIPSVETAGGHKGAGSIGFNKKVDFDIIEQMVTILEEVKSECILR